MKLTFLRNKGYGVEPIRAIVQTLRGSDRRVPILCHNGPTTGVLRTDMVDTRKGRRLLASTDMVANWGTTVETGLPTLNTPDAVRETSDKKGFRIKLQEASRGVDGQIDKPMVPRTVTSVHEPFSGPQVVRPSRHMKGRDTYLVNNRQELVDLLESTPSLRNWYASNYINKVAEYGVFIMAGRIVTIARKFPDDEEAIAWNVENGGHFDVVRFGDWPTAVCEVATRAFSVSSLDFARVDVMVGADGRTYVCEINTAPAVPFISDG